MAASLPISIFAIPDLDEAQVTALQGMGIRFAEDLLHFRPVHDAILLKAIADRQIVYDFSILPIVDAAHANLSARELLALAPDALASVTVADARLLDRHFGVKVIADLVELAPAADDDRVDCQQRAVF